MSLEFSTAAWNLTHVMVLVLISSSTLGTVNWSSLIKKGSSPARNAEVSKISVLCGVVCVIFYPMPLKSSLSFSLL